MDSAGDFVVGPLLAADGRKVFGLQVRASGDGNDDHTVLVLFDTQRVLADVLDKRAPGFAVAVSAEGHEVYRRDAPAGELKPSLRKTESLVLPDRQAVAARRHTCQRRGVGLVGAGAGDRARGVACSRRD